MTQLNLSQTTQPNVQIINGQVTTTSINVAEFFGKNHNHVLRDIRKLIEDEPEWSASNFGQCEIIRDIPLQGEKSMPCYTMTRDGFMMVVMSYTGEKARKIKIAYIEAFNAMEARLLQKPQQPQQLDAPSTKDDRRPITSLISVWVGCAPVTYKEAWQMVHARFNISSVDELMASQIEQVAAWIQERIDRACATPARDFDVIMEQLRGSRDVTTKEVKQAFQEWEASGGYDTPGGADLIYNLRQLYEHIFNLALAAPLALDSLNRMEADLYRNAAIRLRMQKLVA